MKDKIKEYADLNSMLGKMDDESVLNENANKDSKQYHTMINLTAGLVGKSEGIKMLPRKVALAHIEGDIHFHDLSESPRLPMTNCFRRDTRFVTDKGTKSFEDYESGDKIKVLTPKGGWKDAVVKSYGIQKLNKITLKKGASKGTSVYATPNHRWILKDGTSTVNLQKGDRLTNVATAPNMKDIENEEYWVRGFVYGDGSSWSKNGSRILLCGNKAKYTPIFERNGFHISSSSKTGTLLSNAKIPKESITEENSLDQISSFIQGWLEADGSYKNANKSVKSIITVGKEEDINIFRQFSSVGGYHIIRESILDGQETNYGIRGKTRTFQLSVNNYFNWKVDNIEETDIIEEVWCLEVEEDKAFVLEGGIPTGNCCLVDFKTMFENGFKIGNAEVSSPKSIQTATAQMAQVIASVSSSQYGGTSIDRIDELLAPFAEMNHEKHVRELNHLVIPWLNDKNKEEILDRVEKMALEKTYKDIYDAIQSLEYEINTLFTSNGQTPFVTIGFGMGTNKFEREIQKAILKVRIDGLGVSKRTAIFPKLIFGIRKGVNFSKEDPNYDIKQLALECSAKRMYPDIINYDKLVEITGSYKAPMGK